MLEAHYSGLFDYSTFNGSDSNSYQRELFALRYCFNKRQQKLIEMQIKQVESTNLLKLVSIPSDNLDAAEKLAEGINNFFEINYELIWPGFKENKETTDKINTDVKEVQSRWESRFGDMNSDEVKAKLARYEKSLKNTSVDDLINKENVIYG